MKNRSRYLIVTVISVAILLGAVAALLPLATTAKWVGFTDIAIHFAVSDANTGLPVPHAKVHVQAREGGLCDAPPLPMFSLTTDGNGKAEHLATGCMCSGSDGAFEDTFSSHLPPWTFVAEANGYSTSAPQYLDALELAGKVQQSKPIPSVLVPIQLAKDSAEQSLAAESR
jgi:hypothetical protein